VRIDAHQHFWPPGRADHGRLTPDLAPLHRDYGPRDLKPHIDRHHVKKTILVQAAPTPADTSVLLDLAKDAPFVAGVVGCADLEAADAAQIISSLAADPLLVGLRPMNRGDADADWSARPGFAATFQALAAHKLVVETPVTPRRLAGLIALLDRHPDVAVVADHGAKSFIRDGKLDPWRAEIAAVAKHPRIHCKLSGLVTEAGEDWRVAHLRPYVDHLLAQFMP
jgi:L-fuconolactonase